jgi:proteasome lid subunit RPN8/RPN11
MDYHLEDFRELTNTKPILKALKFGSQDSHRESCGLFVFKDNYTNYDFFSLSNENLIENEFFISNNTEYLQYFVDDQILCLFHTHTKYDEQPSILDIEMSESTGLPSLIFSLQTKECSLYYPLSYKPRDLKNRIFIPFFQDCVNFVKDFFLIELNINLALHIKNWARKRSGANNFLFEIIDLLFVEVNINNRAKGDLVLFYPTFSSLFHLGIIYTENYIYHHPMTGYPKKELFTQNLSNKVYKIYRYKD